MKIIFVLLFILSPHLVFAAHQSILLAPDFSDVSLKYLSNAFGVMDGVLHGTESQILGHMSKMFNTILFCVVGVAWSYTAFVGILNTASEGQFLGQRGSLWGPLRVVVGTVLLMPRATGYSLIQIIVMHVIVQGIGAANQIWNVTLNYLERSGATVEMSRPMRIMQTEGINDREYLVDLAGKLLKAEFCTLVLTQTLHSQKNYLNTPIVSLNHAFSPEPSKSNVDISRIYFPSGTRGRYKGSFDRYKGLCGYVEWKKNQNTNDDFIGSSIQVMMYGIRAIAQQAVNQWLANTTKNSEDKVFLVGKNILNLRQGALINTSSDFYALVKNYLRYQETQRDLRIPKVRQEFNNMRRQGWIMAVSYYFRLASLNKEVGQLTNPLLPQDIVDVHLGNVNTIKKKLSDKKQQKTFIQYLQAIDDYIEEEKMTAVRMDEAQARLQKNNRENLTEFISRFEGRKANIFYPFRKNLLFFQTLMQYTLQHEIDPLVSLSKVGKGLLKSVQNTWAEMKVEKFLEEMEHEKIFISPLILIWMILNFTLSATLVYYVPLVPFIIFFFGSLTWFILAITFVIVSPLIALGMMGTPGSQQSSEPFPKLEAAIMPLLSLFLRPTLMIFGLIASMIVCTFAFNLFHYGYHVILPSLIELEHGGWFEIFGHTAMMVVYTSIALSIVNRSFGLIYEVPNTALRFIGGAIEGHSESEPLMQVKSGIERYTGDAGSRIGQGWG